MAIYAINTLNEKTIEHGLTLLRKCKFVDGLPGTGKSTRILEEATDNDIIVTMTRANK